RDFEIVSAPLGTSGAEFRDIARAAASIDTLDGFLRDMQVRYPDASPVLPSAPTPPGASTSSAPASPGGPATRPAAVEPAPPGPAAG
ncbi:MAG: hypothetical protein ACLP19_18470, partial [Xanthobacteraceae bacterium]